MRTPGRAGALVLAVFLAAACAERKPQPTLLEQGLDLDRRGKLDGALAALRGAASLDPADPVPVEALARVFYERGWLASATQAWEKTLADCSGAAAGPKRGRAWIAAADGARMRATAALLGIYLARGLAASRQQLWGGAAMDYRRATELAPDSTEAWPGLARAAGRLGDKATACRAYRRCFYLIPADPDLALGYADAANALKHFEEALAACRRYTALKPGDARGWNNEGTVLVELGRFDEGKACFDKALALQPGLVPALNGKGSACYYQKRYDEARALWGAVLDLAPDDPTATRNLRTLVQMGL